MLRISHCPDDRLTDGGEFSLMLRPRFTPQKLFIFPFLVLISVGYLQYVNRSDFCQIIKDSLDFKGIYENAPLIINTKVEGTIKVKCCHLLRCREE
jgi:hypothetical protein